MRARINLLLLLVPMTALAVMFQQCSGVNFQNAVLSQQWLKECSEDASKCRAVTENFNAGSSNKNIDFVWVVDTSGSMSQEMDRIRENLEVFVNKLSTYSNLKMAILGKKGASGYALQFPSNIPAGVETTQVDIKVESSDAYILGGYSLCPENTAADSWCTKLGIEKKDYAGNNITGSNWTRYSNSKGTLSTFLRDQSHKVFVFVSDDNASFQRPHVSSRHDFANAYNSRFPHSSPVVYSFVSFNPGDCSGYYARGEEYIAHSAETGGEAFNICGSDWSLHFDKMLEGMETMVNTTFPLATENVVEVTGVFLNNVRLSPGDWTYANRKITIREEAMQNQLQYNIRVELIEFVQ